MELFPLPRSTFNVKCLEMLGSVSFFLSFIVMLKIAKNKEYFNGPWKPSSWGGERTEGRIGRGSLKVGGRRAMQGWKKDSRDEVGGKEVRR